MRTLSQVCIQVVTTVTLFSGQTIGTFTWNQADSSGVQVAPGEYIIRGVVIGTTFSGIHQISILSVAPDFSIAASLTEMFLCSLCFPSDTSTITLTSVGGFTGTIDLSFVVSSPGPEVSLSPSSVTLSESSMSATSTLTVSLPPGVGGSFAVVITASSGELSHSVTITVPFVICDVFFFANPSTLTIRQGSSEVTTIATTGCPALGTLLLFATGPTGFTTVLDPTTITGSSTSTLTIAVDSSVAVGTYTVTVEIFGEQFCCFLTVDVTVVVTPAVTAVLIDIKPGSDPNSINVKSGGVISVAILTTSSFDAGTVDPSTVRFGRTGTEALPVGSGLEDIDGDTDLDLVLHFNTQDTQIMAGDTQATLTGRTFEGTEIMGTDSIRAFFPGDVDGDLQVTIIDAGIGAYAFGSMPASPRWNANADFNENGIIDVIDFGMIAYYYGQHA